MAGDHSRTEILLTLLVSISLLLSLFFQTYLMAMEPFSFSLQGLLLIRLIVAFQGAILGFLIPGFIASGFFAVRVGGALTIFMLVYFLNPAVVYIPDSEALTPLIAALGGAVVAGLLALIAPLTKYWRKPERRDVHIKLPDGRDVRISNATPEELRRLSDAIKGMVDGDKTD